MENLNYEEPSVTQPVTMDALGNTNQDIFNNPFGDFNNQFISDVAIGKSTEITDLVMQQQPENAFNNLTDTMNSINNNKFNNGHDENNFEVEDKESPMSPEADQSVLVLNDDNNNSNENLSGPDMGPETDVDAIDEHFGFEAAAGAVGGAKEKLQMEFKETEDVADRADVMNFIADNSPAAMFGALENKIFEEMSLHNPDLMKANNPFSDNSIPEGVEPVGEFLDNKFEEEAQKAQQHMDDFADQMVDFQAESYDRVVDFVADNFASSANETVLQHQQHADLGAFEATQQVIGESGGEESEDEWNYSKGDKKPVDGLAAVEETSEVILESPVIEKEAEADSFAVEEHENLATHAEQSFTEKEFVEQEFDSRPPQFEDFQQERQEEPVEEEHQVQDEVEKDLQLTIDTEEFDEMSQLNPDAKEFVPVSPTRSNGDKSPSLCSPVLNPVLGHLVSDDAVVSQSPRKGEQPMEDISVPNEMDFELEIDSRPHETADFEANELLNPKEAMQQDDKLEQEYKDEAQPFFEEEKKQIGDAYKVLESSFSEYSNNFQNGIGDAMNRSFYEGRDDDAIMAPAPERQSDVLNSIQPIPTFEDEQPEADHQMENDVPESDMQHPVQEVVHAASDVEMASPTAPKMDSSDNFEAEHFVEEIKSAAGIDESEYKYVDQALSPEIPPFNLDGIPDEVLEKVEFVETHFMPLGSVGVKDFLEEAEQAQVPVPESIVIAAPEEPKADVVAEVTAGVAAVALAAGAGAAVAAKKSATSKAEPKKTEVKKAPVAAAKKAPVAAKAPITKPTSAPAAAKPAPIVKKTTTTTSTTKPAPKPAVSSTAAKPAASSATASRPKPASTLPPVKKPSTGTVLKAATDSSAKPASATATRTSLAAKKPTTSVAATKPLVRPSTATSAAKPKLTNGTVTTERKPLSSAPISRAPAKPTTLASTTAAKPKLNGISSLSAKSPTKPLATTRLSVSAVEKSGSTPVKEKTLNRSVGSAPKASPRPEVKRPLAAAKDSKSPAAATKPTTLTAVGVKKTLSAVKKSPATTTGAALAAKKSPTKVTAVKKTTTTTTTVVQKKVVNGDIVSEETTTTQTTAGDPQLIEDILKDSLAGLNGHVNGNGLAENGAGDTIQMVLDSAAD